VSLSAHWGDDSPSLDHDKVPWVSFRRERRGMLNRVPLRFASSGCAEEHGPDGDLPGVTHRGGASRATPAEVPEALQCLR
jgi:hypothetical protein